MKVKHAARPGITGAGRDYEVYDADMREKLTGACIGGVAGGTASYIMFGHLLLSIIIASCTSVPGLCIYIGYLKNKRKKLLLLQFKDMLDSLSNSYSSGKNTTAAFGDALRDMRLSYGEGACITEELRIIVNGLNNSFTIESLIKDLFSRSGLEDIGCFAETFSVCNRLGGDLKRVVSESRDIISEKIEIEMDIQTLVASNKNEINIMCIMPFVIILMMRTMGENSASANTPLNIAVKLAAALLFVAAYCLGRKITDIRV